MAVYVLALAGLHAGLTDRSRQMQISDAFTIVKRIHVNPVASQALTTSKSIIYMLQRDEQKAPIYKLSRSKAPETQQIEGCKHQRKTSGPSYSTRRAFTFAPAITLPIEVPSQKFLFLQCL